MIQAIIHTDPKTGEVFTYERGSTRIHGDHDQPAEEPPAVPPPGQLVGRDRVTDGAGCTERLSSIERDFLSGESPYS